MIQNSFKIITLDDSLGIIKYATEEMDDWYYTTTCSFTYKILNGRVIQLF